MRGISIRWRLGFAAALTGAFAVLGAVMAGPSGAIPPVLAGTAAAFWYGAALSRAANRAADQALRITAGEREFRLQANGPPELDRVARAVNRLADRLNALIARESAERARLSSIIGAMQEGVIVVDGSGAVESANPASLELLGAPASFRPGQLLTSLTGNYAVNQAATECAGTGGMRRVQVEVHDSRRYLQVTAAPVAPLDGQARRTLILVSDLTELRRTETTRREFVSNASHELRTPIAAIKAAAETLQRGAIDDPVAAAEFLGMIEQDVVRMDALVREMLELSQLESGHTPLHLAPLPVAELLTSIAHRFAHQAGEAGLGIAVAPLPALPPLSADREQVERVLSNLVGNAVKFTRPGGSITLSAFRDGRAVSVTVADTGRGIAAEHLPHVFERFYKVDSSRAGSGTGLGLAIAKHIVQAHGGAISVQSRPGAGATFTVTLPALAED